MFPLLAAIPAIFSAISGASELFDKGKQVYEQVTGKPSAATTPDALQAEVTALPVDVAGKWAEVMAARVKEFEAGTDRIKNEQGAVDAETLNALPPEDRIKVALLRMTTRPWIVRKAMHVILLPVYITMCDLIFMTINGIYRFSTHDRQFAPFDLFAEKIFDPTSVYFAMYQWAASTCALIVVNYMTARTIEKIKGIGEKDDAGGIAAPLDKITSAIATFFPTKKK